MDENINGKYCPRDCGRIPEQLSFEFDTTAFTRPTAISSACCGSPELGPFELHDGKVGQHCWTCGKVFL